MLNLKPALALTFCLASTAAVAHTPYLAPASFEPVNNWVTLDAAFAEKFFLPEVKFDQSEFSVTQPDGQQVKPKELFLGKTRTMLAHELTAEGTYRFSTGQRYGAVFRSWQQDGKVKTSRDPNEAVPAGAKLLAHFQSVTLAETYVSKGAPDKAALQAHGKGLELVFVSHPNDLYIDTPVRARLLFNGQGLAGQKVELFQAGQAEPESKAVQQLTSNAQGEIEFSVKNKGSYLLLNRYRTDAPAGAKAPTYSYSYTAVIEITE
ncbi:DUF4198 domain-containing protein [Rheinheimera marina]|uniref:DUF4198 domain-containing protein n=1 Tax=Rheinheimera marina TaxID=1774958 RepID=A0ABV9JR03_9GAMM